MRVQQHVAIALSAGQRAVGIESRHPPGPVVSIRRTSRYRCKHGAAISHLPIRPCRRPMLASQSPDLRCEGLISRDAPT
jgi:hypothetical protein